MISNSNNGSTFSNAHYINAMFFQTTNQSDYVNHPDVSDKHVNGSVHNGIAMNVKDLNAQYMDENHGLPVMLDPRYQPRSIQWDQYIGNKDEHSIIQKNVNNSNLSPKFSNQVCCMMNNRDPLCYVQIYRHVCTLFLIYIYYRFIVRFLIGLDFLIITFLLHFLLNFDQCFFIAL